MRRAVVELLYLILGVSYATSEEECRMLFMAVRIFSDSKVGRHE